MDSCHLSCLNFSCQPGCDLHLSMKQWLWCEAAFCQGEVHPVQISRAKSTHPFAVFQIVSLVEGKMEEKWDIYIYMYIYIYSYGIFVFWNLMFASCPRVPQFLASPWQRQQDVAWALQEVQAALSIRHCPAFQALSPKRFLMPNTFSDKTYGGS